jgi:hypothetical protein
VGPLALLVSSGDSEEAARRSYPKRNITAVESGSPSADAAEMVHMHPLDFGPLGRDLASNIIVRRHHSTSLHFTACLDGAVEAVGPCGWI